MFGVKLYRIEWTRDRYTLFWENAKAFGWMQNTMIKIVWLKGWVKEYNLKHEVIHEIKFYPLEF